MATMNSLSENMKVTSALLNKLLGPELQPAVLTASQEVSQQVQSRMVQMEERQSQIERIMLAIANKMGIDASAL